MCFPIDEAPADDTLRYHHSIAFENATSVFEQGGDADLSVSFTANSGSNRVACVTFGTDRDSYNQTHTVTFGGAAPSKPRAWDGAGGTYQRSTGDVFIDTEIGSGAKTVRGVGTSGGGNYGGSGLCVVILSGVDQTTPNGTGATAYSDGGGTPSVTVTGLNATDLLVDGLYAWDGGAATAGANQTPSRSDRQRQ